MHREQTAVRDHGSGGDAARPFASPWRLSWPLVAGVALFAALATAPWPLLGDPDSHWHIAIGDWILAQGAVPVVDSHSHTFNGRPWIAKEWLSQLVLALAHKAGGWGAILALCAASIALTFALLLRLLLHDIRALPAALFTAAAVVMTMPHFLARPHVLAFPFLLLWVAGLVRAVEDRRAPRPVLLLAMLVWANLHGGFTLGLVLCGAFALEAVMAARHAAERRRLLAGWAAFGIAALLAACLTPYGPQSMLVTLRIFGLGDALNLIDEWQSPDFQAQPLQEIVVLIGLALCLAGGLKLPLLRLPIVIGLVHLFLVHARNAELLAMLVPLAMAPALARQFPSLRHGGVSSGRPTDLSRPAGRHATLLAVSLAVAFSAGMVGWSRIRPSADTTPAAALAFARQAGLTGPVFNHYGFGGFLIGAGIPTFIDGRAELFGRDFILRYADAVSLRGTEPLEDMLDRYGIEWTFLQKDQAANKLLERLPGWRRAYGDDTAIIFVRRHDGLDFGLGP